MNPLLFHPLAGLTESDRIALSFDCFESDGAAGGGFWDSISKFFGGGGGAGAEPGFSGNAGNILTEAAGQGAGTAALDTAVSGINFGKVAGDASRGAIPSLSNSTGITPNLESPGPGAGAVAAPGSGAAAAAAPASVSPEDAARGINVGGAVKPQAPGFTNAVVQNNGLSPDVLSQSTGKGTGTSIDTLLADPSMKNLMKSLGANANVLLPAAGLGAQVLQSQKSPEGLDALRASAERSNNQGAIMQKYLETGTLPPGLQAGLDSAREAAKGFIRARYANLPGQSSAMEQELAAADQTAAAKGGELAIQLFQRGMDESNISNHLYEAILQQDLERDKELGAAVGNFTTALAGGGPHVTLNFGGR